MASDKARLVPSRRSLAATAPTPRIPLLPQDSGALSWTATGKLRKDTAFVEQHEAFLRARVAQARAAKDLIEARGEAGLALARLQALPERAEHEYQRGRAEREREKAEWQHQERLQALDHERLETEAQALLALARQRLADMQPKPPPEPEAAPSPPPAPPPVAEGLTPADVEAILQRFPDLKPELIEPIVMTLRGVLAEKKQTP